MRVPPEAPAPLPPRGAPLVAGRSPVHGGRLKWARAAPGPFVFPGHSLHASAGCSAAARRARVPRPVVRLAGGEHDDVDERRRGRLADDDADRQPGDGGAGADRVHAAGVPARPAQRRAWPTSSTGGATSRHAAVGLAGGAADRRLALARAADGRAAAAADLPERHRPGDALAGVLGHRARGRHARAAAVGAGAERHLDEPVARHRPHGGRRAAGVHRHGLGVRAERAAGGCGLRADPALEVRRRAPARCRANASSARCAWACSTCGSRRACGR